MNAMQDYYRECHGKKKYRTRAESVSAAKTFTRDNKEVVLPYECFYCKQWHFGHPSPQKLERVKAYYEKTRANSNVP